MLVTPTFSRHGLGVDLPGFWSWQAFPAQTEIRRRRRELVYK